MALKVFDGFDHYNSESDFVSRSGFLQWQLNPVASSPAISFITGSTGFGKQIQVQGGVGSAGILAVWGARNAEFFTGWRLYCPSASGSGAASGAWLIFNDSIAPGPQVSVYFNENNYAVQVYRGGQSGTLLGSSPNNSWTGGVSNYIEIGLKINGSTGYVTIKNNGVTILSLTSQNTQATANAWADTTTLLPDPYTGGSVSSYFRLDDVYYCDTTSGPGTYPCNTFLGDVRVGTLFATGNDAVQFTPLANANWQEISEVAMDSDTSYNFDATAGHQDTFVFNPLSSIIAAIYGLQITYAARKDDAGSRTMAGVIRISGTSYIFGTPDTVPASGTYAYYSDLWILNPATSLNFTLSDVNAATYGYKLVT